MNFRLFVILSSQMLAIGFRRLSLSGVVFRANNKISRFFSMNPIHDSKPIGNNLNNNGFQKLGVIPQLLEGLSAQGLTDPTPVQKTIIPRLIGGENVVMAASTGSGKTLAYMLPTIQSLLVQEMHGYDRKTKRPRCLVLVPTRELARQVLTVVKSLSHYAKVSSSAVLGGEEYSLQKKSLDRLVDIVVASPGRLLQHKIQGNVFLSHVTHIVIDEVDTMLTQGFGSDIRAILRSVLKKKESNSKGTDDEEESRGAGDLSNHTEEDRKAQLIMASATLTKAVRALLDDVKGFDIEYSDPTNKTPKKESADDTRIGVNVVEVDGVHRSLPNIQHNVEETKGADKVVSLLDIIRRQSTKSPRTMVFCNTVDSCRAVEYAMKDAQLNCLSYHGDLNSRDREANLEGFRNGTVNYLVCTDIAARGLDIPEIGHVIMFDFPLNPIDYLHRAGRTGRAGKKGLVTAIVAKRDKILSDAIQGAIARGLPLDSLTSSKRDYQDRGNLAGVVGRVSKDTPKKNKILKFGLGGKGKPMSKNYMGKGKPEDSPEAQGRRGASRVSRNAFFAKSKPAPSSGKFKPRTSPSASGKAAPSSSSSSSFRRNEEKERPGKRPVPGRKPILRTPRTR